jgi:hypothetical protein
MDVSAARPLNIMINSFPIQSSIFSLIVISILLNAILALITAHIFPVSNTLVIFSELSIYVFSIFLIVKTGPKNGDKPVYQLFAVIVFATLLVSIAGGFIFVDAIRNFLIICLFTLLGLRINEVYVHKAVFTVSVCVFTFLVIEIISLDLYVSIFEPAKYYASSRGKGISEFNELGVFNAALGFSTRFSYGIFSGPRASSVFLEQVGLGNFSQILCIYLLVFNKALKPLLKLFYMLVIFVAVTSAESRSAGGVIALFILIFLFKDFIPAYTNALVLPFVLFIGFAFLNLFEFTYADNLSGRFYLGMKHLADFNVLELVGGGIKNINNYWDSGYPYLLASTTIFGVVSFYFFCSFYLHQGFERARLLAILVTLYIFLNIIVSGNSTYSIKTAPLLWLMFGFVGQQRNRVIVY